MTNFDEKKSGNTQLILLLQKGDAIDEVAEAVQDLAEVNEPINSKDIVEKQVKGNLKTFLEDVDIQRSVRLILSFLKHGNNKIF